MRKWVILFGGVAIIGWMIAANIASSIALADFAARPVVALSHNDGTRLSVQTAGQPASEGQARNLGGQGTTFGARFVYVLPTGGTVTCTIRFRIVTCADGWQAERAPPP